MSAVARKFLGVTATSVASERVFSKTGYIQCYFSYNFSVIVKL